jgi:hypothetical protein
VQSIWYSIKVSIAGARLSHLVQKDQIWDHGSMIEQVRSVFYQVQKAKAMADTEIVRKYVTIPGYESIKEQIEKDACSFSVPGPQLADVAIIGVGTGNRKRPDFFKALLQQKNIPEEIKMELAVKRRQLHSACWLFLRQGDWWLLDRIREKPGFFQLYLY